jgi:diadenosine tetraphosphatase ApaH/serine/threonine PP2A family protein phosphatase
LRILVISDVHANLAALDAVLQHCGPVDAVWNLGDTVGYGPHPTECLDVVTAFPSAETLAGNHDLACVGEISYRDFNPAAATATRWTSQELRPKDREVLRSLPAMLVLNGVTLAHASPRDPVWEYIDSAAIAGQNFSAFDTPLCLVGHTHVPALSTLDARSARVEHRHLPPKSVIDLSAGPMIVNPGSVGQPRDGDPRAAYAIIDADALTLTTHRVDYDIWSTQQAMEQAGLPERLRDRLAYGR